MSGISVRLRKRVPGFELDVAWRVPAGFTVMFGYSGAGKSLTLALLTGAMRPDEGHVTIAGHTMVDTRTGVWVTPQQRRIGYVPQGSELFPHMTVRRNIEYGLKGFPAAEKTARITELLDAMHIAPIAEKYPREISGGQRQRAALARALAPRPRALLLDEPLSALDLPVRVEMRALLKRVQQEQGIPVVMVTHDLYEAAILADSLVVYGADGVVQTGSLPDIVRDPGTPEIRRLMHSMELPAALLADRRGVAA